MCIISDKIKFCTCTTGSVANLKHYWILYRFAKGKEEFCIGTPMIPTSMIDSDFKENQTAILKRLSEPDTFDIPIEFKNKDVLEIVINNRAANLDTFIYSFQFKNNKWKAIETDPFDIMNHFDEENSGKIKNALRRGELSKMSI